MSLEKITPFINWIKHWLWFLSVFILTWIIYATIWSEWTDPSELETTSWSTLSSSNWNKLLENFNSINNRVNSVYNSWTTNTILNHRVCSVNSPVWGKIYDCNWNILWTTWYTEVIYFDCPSWYRLINGAHWLPDYTKVVRQSHYYNNTRWVFTTNWTFSQIQILCMKVE